MAEHIKGIEVQIGGDTTGLVKALQKVNKDVRNTQSELGRIDKLLKTNPANTELIAQKQKVLGNIIAQNTEKVIALKKAKHEADQAMQRGEQVNQEQYRLLQREIINTENRLKSYRKEINLLPASIQATGKVLKEVGNEVTNAGKKVNKLSAGVVATGVAATKTGMDFESAFVGVRKTTEATEEEYEELRKGILQMSKELPATAVEIANVAEVAGQLGIKKESLLDFTRTMIDLGQSTNLSAEEAASALAKFANITNMNVEDYSRLGSVVVALGNNFATTEADIVSMATRLASTGELVGLSESQIMALATAMSSVGIEAEAGGTAMAKLLKQIQVAVEVGGKDLEQFAKVSGMSVAKFRETFATDAVGALSAFIGGLNNTERNGKSAIAILNEMGISEVRLSNTILALANANGVMSDSVSLANKAWEENTALTKEAQQRYATAESKLKMLGNKIKAVAIELADSLLPAVNKIVDKIGKLADKFSNMSDRSKELIVTIGGIIAVLGPLLTITGQLITATGTVIGTIGQLTTKVDVVKGAFKNLWGVAASHPYGALALAIAGVTVATIAMINKSNEASETVKALQKEVDDINSSFNSTIESIENVNRKAEGNALVARNLSDELYNLAEKEDKSNLEKDRMASIVERLNELIPNLNLQINESTGALNLEKTAVNELITSYINLAKSKAYAEKAQAEAKHWADLNDTLNNQKNDLGGAKYNEQYYKQLYEKIKNETPVGEEQIRKQLISENAAKDMYEYYAKEVKNTEALVKQTENAISGAEYNMNYYQEQSLKLQTTTTETGKKISDTNNKIATSNNTLTSNVTSNSSKQISAKEKKAEKEAELSKERLKTAEQFVENKKFYNQMSIGEELEYWKKIKETETLGATELEEVNKKIYTAKQELSKQLLDNGEKYISNLQFYNDITLSEEISFWEQMRKVEEIGGNELAEIDKKIYTARKNLSTEMQKVLEDEIKSNEEARNKHNQALESRADSLKSFAGLFDEISEKEDITGKKLLKNLEEQVKSFENWQKNIEKLSNKGISEELFGELKELGPSMAQEVEALTRLSDSQLKRYDTLYQKKNSLATSQARSELGDYSDTYSTEGIGRIINDLKSGLASVLLPNIKTEGKSDKDESFGDTLIKIVQTLLTEGANGIAEAIFNAIPATTQLMVNGKELAETTWRDLEKEVNEHGKNFYTREQVADIARSVMPRGEE